MLLQSFIKFVHCTLNKSKLTFLSRATLSHFTCVHGGGGGGLKVFVFSVWVNFGQELFCKECDHLQFREQAVKIGMGLILRWGSVQGVQGAINVLPQPPIVEILSQQRPRRHRKLVSQRNDVN